MHKSYASAPSLDLRVIVVCVAVLPRFRDCCPRQYTQRSCVYAVEQYTRCVCPRAQCTCSLILRLIFHESSIVRLHPFPPGERSIWSAVTDRPAGSIGIPPPRPFSIN